MVPEGIEGRTAYKGELLDVVVPMMATVAKNIGQAGFKSITQAANEGQLLNTTTMVDYAQVTQNKRIITTKEAFA
jgi:IMP dehydrogenase